MNPFQLKRLFPNASKSVLAANSKDYGTGKPTLETSGKIPNPKPEQNQANALEQTVSGEAACVGRTGVRFILRRVRPLDPDNAAASCKDLLDGLVRSKILPGDAIWQIEFSVRQEKVKRYSEEETVIEVYELPQGMDYSFWKAVFEDSSQPLNLRIPA